MHHKSTRKHLTCSQSRKYFNVSRITIYCTGALYESRSQYLSVIEILNRERERERDKSFFLVSDQTATVVNSFSCEPFILLL